MGGSKWRLTFDDAVGGGWRISRNAEHVEWQNTCEAQEKPDTSRFYYYFCYCFL